MQNSDRWNLMQQHISSYNLLSKHIQCVAAKVQWRKVEMEVQRKELITFNTENSYEKLECYFL